MPFRESGELRYFQFGSFDPTICQAVFTRHGGVSPSPWASLNMGGMIGDDPRRVRENCDRALAALGRSMETVYDVWQVHGEKVVIATAPRSQEVAQLQADAILTDRCGLTLLMRFADCVPILLHDPLRKVVGIVHAGWLGTIRGISSAAITAMQNQFGSNPGDILAGIGPSIGPDHYYIGTDVSVQVQDVFGKEASNLLIKREKGMVFDLWAANRLQLFNSGVKQIETADVCTSCHTDDWFSHRAEHGQTGRFGAIIGLN